MTENCEKAWDYGNWKNRKVDKNDEIDKKYKNYGNFEFHRKSRISENRRINGNSTMNENVKEDENEEMMELTKMSNNMEIRKLSEICSFAGRSSSVTHRNSGSFTLKIFIEHSCKPPRAWSIIIITLQDLNTSDYALQLKSEGEAARRINSESVTLADTLRDLKRAYRSKRTLDKIQADIGLCVMEQNETVVEYCDRVTELLGKAEEVAEATIPNEAVRLDDTESRVFAEKQTTLAEAMDEAMARQRAVANRTKFHTLRTSTENSRRDIRNRRENTVRCAYCGHPGHIVRECRTKQQDAERSRQENYTRTGLTHGNYQARPRGTMVTCTYCKREGHAFQECRTQMREKHQAPEPLGHARGTRDYQRANNRYNDRQFNYQEANNGYDRQFNYQRENNQSRNKPSEQNRPHAQHRVNYTQRDPYERDDPRDDYNEHRKANFSNDSRSSHLNENWNDRVDASISQDQGQRPTPVAATYYK
ncbi:uncharacterized protein LOC125500296 [Athalia rosae]|uniref:uncharacterized protein LOC125500296 n=1 Tax=Athalia rosae TaxID=37344 RepID=UPI0020334346|nr:uncharacterized protein LOC125500296 [Athalia rosae]